MAVRVDGKLVLACVGEGFLLARFGVCDCVPRNRKTKGEYGGIDWRSMVVREKRRCRGVNIIKRKGARVGGTRHTFDTVVASLAHTLRVVQLVADCVSFVPAVQSVSQSS